MVFLLSLAPFQVLRLKCKCYVMRHAVSLLLSLVPEHCMCAGLKRISHHRLHTRTRHVIVDVFYIEIVVFVSSKYSNKMDSLWRALWCVHAVG